MFEWIDDIKYNRASESANLSKTQRKLMEQININGGKDGFMFVDLKPYAIDDNYYKQYKGRIDPYVKPGKDWISYDEILGYDLVIVNGSYNTQKTTLESYSYTSGYEVTVNTSTGNVTNVDEVSSTGYSPTYHYDQVSTHHAFFIKKIDPSKREEIIEKEKEYIKYYPMIRDISTHGKYENIKKIPGFLGFLYNLLILLTYLAMICSSFLSVALFSDFPANKTMMIELFNNIGLMSGLAPYTNLLIPFNIIVVLGFVMNIVMYKYNSRFSRNKSNAFFIYFGIYVFYMVFSLLSSVFKVNVINFYAVIEIPYLVMYFIYLIMALISLGNMLILSNIRFINRQIEYRQFLLQGNNLKEKQAISAWLKKNKLSHNIPKIIG